MSEKYALSRLQLDWANLTKMSTWEEVPKAMDVVIIEEVFIQKYLMNIPLRQTSLHRSIKLLSGA